ncbi:MAG: tRNA (adenosine(37)-N6)-threonylcarbamoyltransferase complex transferase subunit TsaD [bacterium]
MALVYGPKPPFSTKALNKEAGRRLILGIETSCDETGVAVFDATKKQVLSNVLFSQVQLHEKYGGVVPEIASRSQLEKITVMVHRALEQAQVSLDAIDVVGVTNTPGLVGSLLIGTCFAKALAYSSKKKLIGVDHLEGHIFSPFLKEDGTVHEHIPFPHLSLTASGGHTALYVVKDFGNYELIAQTHDDAAGEAFDKIAHVLGFTYPGGAKIEQHAAQVGFKDFFNYPRTKNKNQQIMFSFSGLKTAVLYGLVDLGAYDLHTGVIEKNMTLDLQQKVSSSLLVCIADIFEKNMQLAFKQYPQIQACTFAGGVACNKYLRQRMAALCQRYNKSFITPSPQFCTDNGAMIAFVAGYKALQGAYSDFFLDVSS